MMTTCRLNAIASAAMVLLLITTLMTGCETGGPKVAQTQPANETKGVATAPATVTITFDEDMLKPATQKAVNITPSVGTQPPTYQWVNACTLKVTYPQNFQPNTVYTVRVETDAKTEKNVGLAKPMMFTFRTGAATVAPTEPATPEAAAPGEPEETATAALTFTKNIKPLAQAKCDGCHAGMATGRMSVYATAMKYVRAGSADQSSYYTRPIGNNHVNAWTDAAPTVRNWINAGAKE